LNKHVYLFFIWFSKKKIICGREQIKVPFADNLDMAYQKENIKLHLVEVPTVICHRQVFKKSFGVARCRIICG